MAFPAIAAAPSVVSAGNLAVLHVFAPRLSPAGVVTLLLALLSQTAVFALGYGAVCARSVANVERFPNAPLSSRWRRWVWGGLAIFANVGVLAVLAALLWTLVRSGTRSETGSAVVTAALRASVPIGGTAPALLSGLAILLLVSPAVAVALYWLCNLFGGCVARRRLLRDARDLQVDCVDADVRVVESPQVWAAAVRTVTGRRAVVVSSSVADHLADDELAAVVLHERYHHLHRDGTRNLLASLLGLFVGGKNVLVAFYDYPEIERRADAYAAARAGERNMVTALRRLEGLRAEAPSPAPSTRSDASGGVSGRLRRVLLGPYRLLFGSVVLENAHAEIDQRIEWLVRDDSSDTANGDSF